MTATLFLIRHGETSLAGTFCGSLDPPLTPRGEQQAVDLVSLLNEHCIDAIYSSNLQRAFSTSQPLARARGFDCIVRPGLREIGFGRWEGLRWSDIERDDPENARYWLGDFPRCSAPNGEQYKDFERRIQQEADALMQVEHDSVAVVSHAGVIRLLLTSLAGLSTEAAWAQVLPYGVCLRAALQNADTVTVEMLTSQMSK